MTVEVLGHEIPIPDMFSDLPQDVLRALAAGMAFGQTGLPDGIFGDKVGDLAKSPFYVIGQLALSFVPTIGSIADARDALQDAANGKWVTAALSGLGAIPLVHQVVQGQVAIRHFSAWKASLGGEMVGDLKKLSRLIVKYIAPHMPDSLAKAALDITTNDAASTLVDEGISMDNVLKYARDGNLGKIAEATESKSMVVGRTDLSVTQWANLVNKGKDPEVLSGLVRDGFTGNAIERLGREGANFKRARRLRSMDTSAEDVVWFVENGHSLKRVETLVNTGAPPELIRPVYKWGSRTGRFTDWYSMANDYCSVENSLREENRNHTSLCDQLPTQ